VSAEQSVRVSTAISISGSVHSVKKGNVRFGVDLNIDGRKTTQGVSGQATFKVTARYADFSAEAKVVESETAGNPPDIKYFLNAEGVSGEVFTKFQTAGIFGN
jgi:hypothetical protein